MSKPCEPLSTFHRFYHVQKCAQRASRPLRHPFSSSSYPSSLLPSPSSSSLFMFAYFVSPSFPASHRPPRRSDRAERRMLRRDTSLSLSLPLPLSLPPLSLWRSKYRQLQIFRRRPPLLHPAIILSDRGDTSGDRRE